MTGLEATEFLAEREMLEDLPAMIRDFERRGSFKHARKVREIERRRLVETENMLVVMLPGPIEGSKK